MSYYRTCKGVRRMWELNQSRLNKQQSPILSSEVLIGRIIPGRTPYEEASGFRPGNLGLKKPEIEVRVPYYVYDKYYKWFFQHEWDFSVNDPKNLGNEGDIVLIKKLGEPISQETISLKEAAEAAWWETQTEDPLVYKRKDITHDIIDVIQRLGDVIDPATGESVVADRYRSEIERTSKLYGESKSDFVYAKAPKRGSQKDKRDFSYRRTYKKWHQFKNDDPYAIVC